MRKNNIFKTSLAILLLSTVLFSNVFAISAENLNPTTSDPVITDDSNTTTPLPTETPIVVTQVPETTLEPTPEVTPTPEVIPIPEATPEVTPEGLQNATPQMSMLAPMAANAVYEKITYNISIENIVNEVAGIAVVTPETFNFLITDANAVETRLSVVGNNSVSTTLEFSDVGTYTYQITNVVGSNPNYVYDLNTYNLEVIVEDVEGVLTPTTKIIKTNNNVDPVETTEVTSIEFVNNYDPEPIPAEALSIKNWALPDSPSLQYYDLVNDTKGSFLVSFLPPKNMNDIF